MPIVRAVAALLIATLAWLPAVHLFYPPPPRAELAARLTAEQLARWRDPATLERLRRSNAEWDFMARTFWVLALANAALAEPARADEVLAVIDPIVESTLELERAHGMEYFLMPYAQARPFVVQPARSLFVDGELAAMIGARRLVRDDPRWAALHRARAALIEARLTDSPTLAAESYPDEAWTFCHAFALASLAMLDALDGTDHGPLFARWSAMARARLVDPRTGLLVSSYTLSGRVKDGPEGSSIFLAAHCLRLIDPPLAREQYARARRALGREWLGFGWATEWPEVAGAGEDIDSGPTIPVVGASASASAMALLGAASFGDDAALVPLLRSLELAAAPIDDGARRRYGASNALGDAVIAYALSEGPLWARIEDLRAARRS